MHEFPITQRIIQMAEDRCREHGGLRVTDIGLVVGLYSGFIGESIQMYFDVLTEGTLCEGARLRIRTVKPMLRCSQCEALFERSPMSFACPACGGDGHPTEIGKEFFIEAIDVEMENPI